MTQHSNQHLAAADRLFNRLAMEAGAYAKRVGAADNVTPLNYELGLLRAEMRKVMAKLATFEQASRLPRIGCHFKTVSAGDAEMLIEFEYEAGERAVYDLESPACGPGCDAYAAVVSVLVNGVWIDPTACFSEAYLEKLADEIVEGAESREREAA